MSFAGVNLSVQTRDKKVILQPFNLSGKTLHNLNSSNLILDWHMLVNTLKFDRFFHFH